MDNKIINSVLSAEHVDYTERTDEYMKGLKIIEQVDSANNRHNE